MLNFFSENWSSIMLIVVGTFALFTYILQERSRVTEAASLVAIQIDELQDRVKEIQSYIGNEQLNDTAFYESQILFSENYWNKYKHYFIRKMDSKDFRTINSWYDCVVEIQEQQQLMKNLQRNFFFVKQQVLSNLEANYIMAGLNECTDNSVDVNQLVNGVINNTPSDLDINQKEAVANMLKQFAYSNQNVDMSSFWKGYIKKRDNFTAIIDNKGLTPYIPIQIRLSLERALKQYALIEMTGSDGYRTLKRLARRKF